MKKTLFLVLAAVALAVAGCAGNKSKSKSLYDERPSYYNEEPCPSGQ